MQARMAHYDRLALEVTGRNVVKAIKEGFHIEKKGILVSCSLPPPALVQEFR